MKTKYCSYCKGYVSIKLFSLNGSKKDGLQHWCKQCVTDDSRTLMGVVRKIYSAQRRNSRYRGHLMPAYSLNKLRVWCLSKPKFIIIHSAWIDSNFERELAPSVDRLKDDEGYSFNNIQVMVWRENMVKGHNSPHKNRDELCRPVSQYSLDGRLIATFHSIYEAGKCSGVYKENISGCCRGQLKTAGKFIWKFKG